MDQDIYTIMENRRSNYALGNTPGITDIRLAEILTFAVKHVPSAFNSQSGRAVLLLGDNHKKLWEIVLAAIKPLTPAQAFPRTEKKIAGFSAAYGTVLFLNDTAVTKQFAQDNPLYKDLFAPWAQHASGMLQYAVWNLLYAEGLGASLQHYNPVIDEAVKKQWDLPESWELIAQMPFGNIISPPGEKEFIPVERRMKVFD